MNTFRPWRRLFLMQVIRKKLLVFILLLPASLTPYLHAQTDMHDLRAHPDWPVAADADVRSPRAIVEAFFSAISAPKGGRLDQARLNSLFLPDGRIEIPLAPAKGAGTADVVFMTPAQYATRSDEATAREGFFDHALAQHVQRFGLIAHVFVSYASSTSATTPQPFVRGVKSFELFDSGSRWYIVQVSWDVERDGLKIPPVYLKDQD